MRASFEKIVEEIQKLPLVEKEEIKLLVEKYIIEERREEIYQNYKKSKTEVSKGNLVFTQNIEDMKKSV